MTSLVKKIEQKLDMYRWRLFTVLDGSKLRTFKLFDMFEINYPLKSEVGKQLFFKKFEIDEVSFLKSVIRQGDVVMDLGANAGIYSILSSHLIGSKGKVYAFEIGPKEIKLFRHNLTKNNIKNVSLFEYAVSNQTGEARFAISQDGAMNSLAKNGHPHQIIQEWLTVNTITLDDWAHQYAIDRVDIIKMDVEGAEKLVFEGGSNALERWKPRYILFEASDLTAPAFGYTVSEFISYLYQKKYNVYALEKNELVPVSATTEHRPDRYNFVAVPM